MPLPPYVSKKTIEFEETKIQEIEPKESDIVSRVKMEEDVVHRPWWNTLEKQTILRSDTSFICDFLCMYERRQQTPPQHYTDLKLPLHSSEI